MNRKTWIVLALGLTGLIGCGADDDHWQHDGDRIEGSGTVVREARSVDAFHGVRLVGVGKVDLAPSATSAVVVEADDNVQRHVTTEVVDGVLEIGIDPGSYWNVTLIVHVAAPALDRVELTGAGDVAGGVSDASSLAVVVTGTGAVTLTGAADALTVDLEGTGAFHGYGLVSSACTARLTGTGGIEVTATESLDASVAGLGSIRYDGSPATVETAISGLGSIRAR